MGTAELGPDGHPRREGPILVDFPRRMWVGGEVRCHGSLQTDTTTVRRTRLVSHARKQGSTGPLLVVSLEHRISQDEHTAVIERQDVIYRQAGGVTPPVGPPVAAPPATDGWRESVVPTTTLLFRFSAVTFNSHRIHYDHEYATQKEGYPGLVVHAPLTAILLAESASRRLGRPLRSFAYRASSPLFVDQPVRVDGNTSQTSEGEVATMTATRIDGVVSMTAHGHGT